MIKTHARTHTIKIRMHLQEGNERSGVSRGWREKQEERGGGGGKQKEKGEGKGAVSLRKFIENNLIKNMY